MRNYKLELYQFVDGLRLLLGINNDRYPLDIIGINRNRGNIVDFHRYQSGRFCAAVFLGHRSDTIILNSLRSDKERNFDCAHETLHWAKHRDQGDGIFSCSSIGALNENQFLEWEANEGAAELLIPYRLFIPLYIKLMKKERGRWSYRSFLSIAATRFAVTEAMVKVRFESLKYEISQTEHGTPFDKIEILSAAEQRRRRIMVASVNEQSNSPAQSGKYPQEVFVDD
jgi:Zn-dependent peptidase ImmA (M78 family)